MKHYLLIAALFMTTLFGCSKSGDSVTPETTSELLTRKWSFNDISVKTNAKTYAIPPQAQTLFGEGNTVTFNKNNTYSAIEDGKTIDAGTWQLSNDNKTLAMTDADKFTFSLAITSITSTQIELATVNAAITKTNPTPDELVSLIMAEFLLMALDKDYGGTIDFTKEPVPTTLQVVIKGKAL